MSGPRLDPDREARFRATDLPAELADELDPFVREKYLELWRAAQTPERWRRHE